MKINRILCVAAILATLFSCGKSNKYTVNCVFESNDFNDGVLYLISPDGVVDSAVVVDNKASFTGTVDSPWIASIRGMKYNKEVDSYDVSGVEALVVEHGTITLKMNQPIAMGGTPLNDRLREFFYARDYETDKIYDSIMNANRHYEDSFMTITDEKELARIEHYIDSLYDILDRYRNKREEEFYEKRAMDFYYANKDNVVGCYVISQIVENNDYSYDQLDSLLSTLEPMVREYAPIAKELENLRCLELTSVGKHYIDVQGVDGKLSDLIDGKLALVDFYASWCNPCRAEIMENLVPLWKKYEKKGLVIVGLNVWERGDAEARKAAHEKVMADLGITYPQLVDSTFDATRAYGVNGIPQILLIDKDGIILARDLRGDAIEEAIIKALGK